MLRWIKLWLAWKMVPKEEDKKPKVKPLRPLRFQAKIHIKDKRRRVQTGLSYLSVPWTTSSLIEKRVTWLGIYGLPLHVWNRNAFKRIAEMWGDSVLIDGVL
ncbi:hypothetical protein J1N35_042818 [Gossypium stocksii]|uniref:DUF4283 domain-containing protein n=1 Tax=Gossypium stocksii TaxID=47602 RepID=A0A9D3U667_9ROSI|nr:hypothetical protein J1N35_042818 [Gossypium stocksii]